MGTFFVKIKHNYKKFFTKTCLLFCLITEHLTIWAIVLVSHCSTYTALLYIKFKNHSNIDKNDI